MRIKHPFILLVVSCILMGINQPAYAADVKLTNVTVVSAVDFDGGDRTNSMLGPVGNVFDSNTSTAWGFPLDPFIPTFITFSLPSPEIVKKCRIVGGNIDSWILYGTSPGSAVLHTGTSSDIGQLITLSNTTAFSHYTLAIWGASITGIPCPIYAITELELYVNGTVTPPATPATPTGPSTDDNGSYTISWSAVSGATSYQLQENLNGGSWSTIYDGSGTSKSRTGRSPGNWNYRVRATNAGGSSSYSSTKTVYVPSPPPVPATPTGPSTDTDGNYTISWSAVSGATSYTLLIIAEDGSAWPIYGGSSTSFDITGQTPGVWGYVVNACAGLCSEFSGIKTVTVLPPPTPPVTPATPTGPSTDDNGSYTISWSAVSGATSYQLEENLNGGSWSTIYDGSGTSKSRTGRSPGNWNYRLRATNSAGSSSYSGTKTVYVPPPPAVPATPTGPSTDYDGSYTISWSPVTGATSYAVLIIADNGSAWPLYQGSSTSFAITDQAAGLWGYRVSACGGLCSELSSTKNVLVSAPPVPSTLTGPSTDADGSYTISWSAISPECSYQLQENFNGGTWSTVYDSSGTSITRTGRSPGAWNYRVMATSTIGSSSYSSTKTVLVAPAAPGTPTGTSPNYSGSYTISWSAVTGASSYTLQEQLNGGSWSTVYSSSGTSTARSSRSAGTWGYRVNACGATCSSYSGTKNVVVSVPAVPAVPTGPSTDADGSYTISWSAVTGASTYQLQENLNGGAWSTVYNSSGTSLARTGRNPGTWNYRVMATNPVGSSSYSSTKTVLVAPAVPGTPTGPSTDYAGSYTISWSAVTGASSYTLQEQLNGGSWSTVYSSSGTSTVRSSRSAGTWGYRVNACGATCSDYSSTLNVVVTAPAIPAVPTGPSIDYDGSYTISWSAVTGATSYSLQEGYIGASDWSTIYTGSSTSVSVTGHSANLWYYRVNACGAACSSYSDTKIVQVSVPAVPARPSGPSTDADGSYTISWSAVTGATSYQLQENLNGGSWSTVYDSSGTSTTISGRSPGTWNYHVRATSPAGSSSYSSTKAVIVTPPVPSAPTGPPTDNDGSYTISWSAVPGATSYTLLQSFMGGDWGPVYSGSSTAASITVSTAGYWGYKVNACAGTTCSDFSDVMAVFVIPPLTPGGLTGPSTDDDGSYTISWNAVTEASSYQLQESLNGGDWSTVYNSSGTSATRSGRSAGVWDYRVRATSPVGSSSYSTTHSVKVGNIYIFDYDANGNMTDMD